MESRAIDRESYEKETVAMSFSLPRRMKWEISEAAKQADKKISKFIRDCIERELERKG